jgi:hypothetical protein
MSSTFRHILPAPPKSTPALTRTDTASATSPPAQPGHVTLTRADTRHPSRAQEIGETISQTVTREVQEETGVNVQVTGLIGIYSDPEHVIAFTEGEVRQEFSICFRAHPPAANCAPAPSPAKSSGSTPPDPTS